MPSKKFWTEDDVCKFLKMMDQKKSDGEIASALGKSIKAVKRKKLRINWKKLRENPQQYFSSENTPNKWAHDEMVRLDAYLQAGKSYDFIADRLNRTYTSVERMSQDTDWPAWRSVCGDTSTSLSDSSEDLIEHLINALLTLGRYDEKRINFINEKEFIRKVNFNKSQSPIKFSEIKKRAINKLHEFGFGNVEHVDMGEGTYIIVGDSHGKFTKTGVFRLLSHLNRQLKAKRIIHIGHLLDDDNDISYGWKDFSNLTVLAKIEELKAIQASQNSSDFNYEIIRETIGLGSLIVSNQDMISDYVKTPISSLDSEIFEPKVIINCHRHEFFSRCTDTESSYIASPGCLCEPHIVRTIKQIDFEDGKIVKHAYHHGFTKYRRMRHMFKYWEQGILVVNVDKNGSHTIVPCLIKKTNKGYTTSYFDKIISEQGIYSPDKKIFVNADIHSPKHDIYVLDIQDQITKDYKPNVFVNLGDSHSYEALNHHLLDKGKPVDSMVLSEAAQTHYVMKKMSKWALEFHSIYGNHERFAFDFVEKYPQFDEYLDFRFLCSIDEIGYKMTNLKNILKIGSTGFIHGDVKMYGQNGSKMEKISRTYGKSVFVGHVHNPGIRFGCYTVGLSGEMDQEYNEVHASAWIHGFGLCNQFNGQDWPTTIIIDKRQCLLNNKKYVPAHPEQWKLKKYKAKLVYDVE